MLLAPLPLPSFPLPHTVIPAQAGIHEVLRVQSIGRKPGFMDSRLRGNDVLGVGNDELVCLVPHFEKGGLGGI